MKKEILFEYIKTTYPTIIDYPFGSDFDSAVFRIQSDKKWFALYMNVSGEKFNYGEKRFEKEKRLDVLNVKCPVDMNETFVDYLSVFPAYHMNKTHWVSILLNYAEENVVKILVDLSFYLVLEKNKKK